MMCLPVHTPLLGEVPFRQGGTGPWAAQAGNDIEVNNGVTQNSPEINGHCKIVTNSMALILPYYPVSLTLGEIVPSVL